MAIPYAKFDLPVTFIIASALTLGPVLIVLYVLYSRLAAKVG